ncbi:hypothetical protein MP638_002462 [Amoeboaphelidium occidentale]|nr:hypothetical protein MP638_002462 [Amoeboaphelidium occidentale]
MPIFTPSEEARAKIYTNFAQEVLAHLYSPNPAYHNRIISLLYHPTLSTYTDPFVAVKEHKRIKSLFNFYFSWFVQSVDLDIHHVSACPTTLTFATSRSSASAAGKPNDIASVLNVLSPVSASAAEDTLDVVNVKKRGLTVLVDYNLYVRELTPLGMLLRFFWLLPATIMLAYAPKYSSDSIARGKGKNLSGLRMITKLHWVADNQGNPASSNLMHERGFITKHEDMYTVTNVSSQISSFLVLLWLAFSNIMISLLQVGYFFLSKFLGVVVFFAVDKVNERMVPSNYVKLLQNRALNLKRFVDKSYPTDFEMAWKTLIGLIWCDVFLQPITTTASGTKKDRAPDVAPVG